MLPKNNLPSLKEARGQMQALIAAHKPSTTVTRLEIRIEPVDMLAWLACQKDNVKVYGSNQDDTMSIAGTGQAVGVTGKTLGSFKDVFQKLRRWLDPRYPYLQWYGGFGFDDRKQDGDWAPFGAYRFVLPRFELAAQGGKMIFCCNLAGDEKIPAVLKALAAIDCGPRLKALRDFTISRRRDDPDQSLWQKNVKAILNHRAIKKAVLARKTSLYFKHSPDPWIMLRRLKSVTPNSYHFAFQFDRKVFLGASPERLFKRYQRFIESEALAGTMPKLADPKSLLNSKKNQYEHALVVDAIEASFKKFCSAHKRDQAPGVLTLANGHHLRTRFQGQLKDGVKDEDILQFLHPTPALGGTPQSKALGVIRRLEGFSRGWYAGPVGYVGLDWAEFVVGIRSGLVHGRHLSVFAGAGIVKGSEPQEEWQEVENKISNFIKIIQ